MLPPSDDPLHDFPDRAFRGLLEEPHNLRDLLADLAPDLAARFDFEQREILPRTFLLDDWRRREADMSFRFARQPCGATPLRTRVAATLLGSGGSGLSKNW